jgi:hypothetical protein
MERVVAMLQIVLASLQIVLFSLQSVELARRLIHKCGIARVWRKTGHTLWMKVTHRNHIRR